MILVDVHGSCVSRNILNFNKESDIAVNQFFSRNNIVSCMMPPADISTSREELKLYESEYSHRCLRYSIEKKTVPLLLSSKADFLVIDFFDLCQPVAGYKNTTFSTYDYTFYNTAAYRNEQEEYKLVNFLDLPGFLWYGYIDLYWQQMLEKFGEKIILVKLHCCNKYISKEGIVKPTPPNLLGFGNAKYNQQLYDLEEYVIKKYDPYVIDVSKYFIPDENYNPDVTPVHFEKNYEISAQLLIEEILVNRPKQKYYDALTPQIVAQLLDRPIDDVNFKDVWEETEHFFVACDLLDDISRQSNSSGIIENRRWLATLYTKVGDIFSRSNLNIEEKISKINDFIIDVERSSTQNDFTRQYIQLLKEKQLYLNTPIEQLLNHFCSALDSGDMKWIPMLNCLGILLPENQDIMYYQLQHYIATDNTINATKLKQRLNLN